MLGVAYRLAAYFAYMLVAMSMASLPLAYATAYVVKFAAPWLVALVATVAAAIAAVFDHRMIRRAFRLHTLAGLRRRRIFRRFERWFEIAPFWMTVAFAGLPVPFAFARVAVPLSGYPLRRYVAAVALGRYVRVLTLALVGEALDIPSAYLLAAVVAGGALAGLAALLRRAGWLRTPEWLSLQEEPDAEPGRLTRAREVG
jgi:uncharacterized membrane protein YdjX (TVP38/TMEM64 family)